MKTINFFLLVQSNITTYLLIIILSFAFYRLIFLKKVTSILDPIYFFIIFTNSICTANVIFLFYTKSINDYYALSYLSTEIALLFGILLFSRPQQNINHRALNPVFFMQIKVGMIISFSIACLSSFIIYFERGIPLFLEVRGDSSGGGSGFGIFSKLFQSSTIIFGLLYFCKYKIAENRSTPTEKLMLVANILFGLLSGYKAFFIFYFFAYYITQGKDGLPSRKNEIYLILISALFMLLIFLLTTGLDDFGLAAIGFLTRIVASGDIYYMAFVEDTLSNLKESGLLFQLFGSILSSFRLISWEQAPINYGLAINELVNASDLNLGPTFRYNVLWLLLTKNVFASTLLSFLVGASIGYMNRLSLNCQKLSFSFIFTAFFYYKSFMLILGPDHAIAEIFTTLIIFSLIYLFIEIILYQKTTVKPIL